MVGEVKTAARRFDVVRIGDVTRGRKARSGALFVFFGKRRTSVKILFADTTGMCLFYKRLDRGVFRMPEALDPDGTSVMLEERALDDLLDGIDIETAPKRARKKSEPSRH